ncbi:hypothetical protein CEXT_481451 [Caerostris extrusa]|uniref:Uncharacterized protein n=1 Tax=Caerostris extrusa TaxID=172846 RepID=A0AAV4WAZ9_CAEEX|nr:hypothetical protein CEXT_481451 [Caerostris extrusa]
MSRQEETEDARTLPNAIHVFQSLALCEGKEVWIILMPGTRSQRQRLWQWHGIRRHLHSDQEVYLFRMQTLKEFLLPVYLFHLSCRVAVELLF